MLSRVVYKKHRGRRLRRPGGADRGVEHADRSGAVLAVNNTGAFELDGNATNDAGSRATTGTTSVTRSPRCGCATRDERHQRRDRRVVDGRAERSATIFTGGGSKDPSDLEDSGPGRTPAACPTRTTCCTASPPATRWPAPMPNDRRHGLPGGVPTTCEVMFFGSDRFDNSGDAQQGFWFFQNKIELGNTKRGGGFKFSGVHQNGDLLIISDFSNGGTVSTISVYKWDTELHEAASNNPADQCSARTCASRANSTPPTADVGRDGRLLRHRQPGAPTSRVAVALPRQERQHRLPHGEFFEGGVNLAPSASAASASPASPPRPAPRPRPTATLKDFVLDNFGECSATLSTQVSNAGPVTPGYCSPRHA